MESNGIVRNCYWFLGGVVMGAAAALLVAPQSGRRTRRMIREKAEDAVESVTDAGHELGARGKNIARDAAQMVNRATRAISG